MAYGVINSDLITTSDGVSSAGLYGLKNRLINGDMRIDQRNAGASVTPTVTTTYTLDRWVTYLSQASKFSVQQNAASVTPPVGFTKYLGCTSASAYSVLTADYFVVAQPIEGQNVADLAWGTANAATVTLSFWVRSSLTGTFGGALSNTSTRSYPFTYTINSSNTWEQKSITIAGDTTGTWLTTNATGISVYFSLGAGATYSSTAGTWAAGNYVSATGATSVVGTSGATFYITGVQLEKGSTATSFDYRPYGTELSLCQRYYYRQVATATGARMGLGQSTSTTLVIGYTSFPVTMRTSPTALEQTGTAANYLLTNSAGANVACSTVPIFNSADTFQANTVFNVASGLAAGNASFYVASAANIYLGWSAEL